MKNIIKLVVISGLVVIAMLMSFVLNLVPDKKQESDLQPLSITPQEIITPQKLHIDSIGVEASIESVGISNGAMAVPAISENAGWYKFGALPGDVGSAVLAGHVNWKNSPNAVFTNLKEVQIGDIIKIDNSDGETIAFLVDDIKSYPLDGDTTEVFSSHDGLAHLNLITCTGPWNSLMQTHELRLVVFTTRI